jgi:hypothetical protein
MRLVNFPCVASQTLALPLPNRDGNHDPSTSGWGADWPDRFPPRSPSKAEVETRWLTDHPLPPAEDQYQDRPTHEGDIIWNRAIGQRHDSHQNQYHVKGADAKRLKRNYAAEEDWSWGIRTVEERDGVKRRNIMEKVLKEDIGGGIMDKRSEERSGGPIYLSVDADSGKIKERRKEEARIRIGTRC